MEQGGAARIRQALGEKYPDLRIRTLDTADSTNLRLKEAARAGAIRPPWLLTADEQTAGRGRLGRTFVSPPGTGLYMSLLLDHSPAASGQVTITAAVAVCRAIEGLTPLRPKIKWVNDLFVRGKKVCGILAEAVENRVIVGIGVNLLTPAGGFPPEAGPAGALDVPVDRFSLAGHIALHLLDGMARDFSAVLDDYRARMPLVGCAIRYLVNGNEKTARVKGIDGEGGLMIDGPDGPDTLRCGEISLGSQSFSDFSVFE